MGALTFPATTTLTPSYAQATGEVGVTTLAWPIGDVRRYGAVPDSTADQTTQLQNAIDSAAAVGAWVYFPGGAYKHAGLTITGMLHWFAGGHVTLTYTGAGSAITANGWSGEIHFGFLNDTTASPLANGIKIGNTSRNPAVRGMNFNGDNSAANMGAAVLLDAGAGVSWGLTIENCTANGYKFGVKFVGTDLNNNTWTSVLGINNVMAGRGAGIIAGSAGVSFDANTNAIGTEFRGGTFENYADGVLHANGGFGGTFSCDFEGNTRVATVGASFSGTIRSAQGVSYADPLNTPNSVAWAPADGSGAGLVITVTGGTNNYVRIGPMIAAFFDITYPVTANGSGAQITLPAVNPVNGALYGGCVTSTNLGSVPTLLVNGTTRKIAFLDATGAQLTNANLSGKTIRGVVFYLVT